jgi:hypothetical protein
MTMRTMTVGGVVLLVAGLAWGFRDIGMSVVSEHDEPVVVDNGPIRITRKGATPAAEGNDKMKWEIHHSGPLTRLRSWSYSGDGGWKEGPEISLGGVGDITFETLDPDTAGSTSSFDLRRDKWYEFRIPQKVRLKSRFNFKYENGALKPDDAAYERHRISSVTADDETVCFRESATPAPPTGNRCQNTHEPVAIKILLCVSDNKCLAPSTAPQ